MTVKEIILVMLILLSTALGIWYANSTTVKCINGVTYYSEFRNTYPIINADGTGKTCSVKGEEV